MKITILTQHFYPEQFLISQLAVDLKRKGHKVSVLTGLPNYPQGDFFSGYSLTRGPFYESYEGVPVYRTPLIPRGKGFLQLALNYASYIFSATVSLFRLPKADVYFVYAVSPLMSAIPALIFRFFNRTPVVIWLQDLWPESLNAVGAFEKSSPLYKSIGKVVRWIYKNTDFILIQSPRFQDNLIEYGFPLSNSAFAPNWGEALPPAQLHSPWLDQLPKDKFIVSFAGNIGIAQAVDTIFDTALLLKQNTDICFAIVGDGRELPRLMQKAKDLDLKNILFFGRKPFSDMSALFERSSALLVSLKKEEIFQKTIPAKAVQYLAAKKPIISAAGGVTNDIILRNNAGVAVVPEDPQALAEATLKLSKASQESRAHMGENGYAYFSKNHTRKIVVDTIENALLKFSK